MSRLLRGFLCLAGCMTLLFISAGCTTSLGARLEPESHFPFPNSNIYPLGKVTGKASSSSIFMVPMENSELQEKAIQKALAQQPGADILINYSVITKTSVIPFFPVSTITYEVEGTAARMEVGLQELK